MKKPRRHVTVDSVLPESRAGWSPGLPVLAPYCPAAALLSAGEE